MSEKAQKFNAMMNIITLILSVVGILFILAYFDLASDYDKLKDDYDTLTEKYESVCDELAEYEESE